MMKNTKFKIEIFDHKTPHTVTTFTDIRLHKVIKHIKRALVQDLDFKVYIKFNMKCVDGTWSWKIMYDEIVKSSFENKNYTFFTWDNYSNDARDHVKRYEKPLRRAIKWL